MSINKNKTDINDGDGGCGVANKINNKIANLLSNIKKIISVMGFLIFKASLAFI